MTPRRLRAPIRVLVLGEGAPDALARSLTESAAGAIEFAVVREPAAAPAATPDAILVHAEGRAAVSAVLETRRRFPRVPLFAVVAAAPGEDALLAILRAGASGLLPAQPSPLALLRAIDDAAAGGIVVPPELARAIVAAGPRGRRREEVPGLTPREIEVLRAVVRGLTNEQIAAELRVSRATIRTHLENVYRKLDVTNRTEASAQAAACGLLDDGGEAGEAAASRSARRR